MTSFGEELIRLLAERGMSLNEAARRSNYDRGHLSKVARGLKRATPEIAERLDEILGGDGALAALADRTPLFGGGLGPDERERLGRAVRQPRRADAAVSTSLASVLAMQRQAEDLLGSAALLPPVKAQLAIIEDLVIEARGTARPALLDVASQWAQFAGWLLANTGDLEAAAMRLGQTLEWAAETGDTTMSGSALSWRGYIAEQRGHVGAIIGLSRAAQRDRAPMGRVYDLYQEARGHAYLGDAQRAEKLIGDAAEMAADGRPEQLRPWEYYYLTPGFFPLEHGVVFRLLGRANAKFNITAVRCLSDALGQLPADARSSEWGALFGIHLATAHAQGGDVRQACAVAVDAAGIARATRSPRLTSMLRRLRAGLATRWPREPSVTELAEALR